MPVPADDQELVAQSIEKHLSNARQVLDEFDQFLARISDQKLESHCEFNHFRRDIAAEVKFLQRLQDKLGAGEEISLHMVTSSNFPHYSSIWTIAKELNGVTAIERRFYWEPSQNAANKSKPNTSSTRQSRKKASAVIDIVADNGLKWIKVSTFSARRILFDMAKAGWHADSDDESDDEDDSNFNSDDEDDEGLLKQMQALIKASNGISARINHQTPSITLVLPRIHRGEAEAVDQIIDKVEKLGVEVVLADGIETTSASLEERMPRMLVDPYAHITPTVNVDCTILLGFISDLSHQHVEKEHWHQRAITHQIAVEKEQKLLPTCLWPACGSRPLVCTNEAATRMWEIVEYLGTESERKRARCLIETDESKGWTREQRLQGFRELSTYDIPEDWQLPIQVVTVDIPEMLKKLPPVAQEITKAMSDINRSVFFYGWVEGITTLSSNRVQAKAIDTEIDQARNGGPHEGPNIWLSPTSRSLVGKEMTRRGAALNPISR